MWGPHGQTSGPDIASIANTGYLERTCIASDGGVESQWGAT